MSGLKEKRTRLCPDDGKGNGSGSRRAGNADDSVLCALDELRELESARLQEQAERQQQLHAEAEARLAEEQRQAEEQRAQQVAEAEARLRMDAEIQRRDAEAEARIAALRAELRAVQCSREAFHRDFLESRSREYDPDTSAWRAARKWKLAFATACTAVAALGLLLMVDGTGSSAPPSPRPIPDPAPASASPLEPVEVFGTVEPAAPIASRDAADPAPETSRLVRRSPTKNRQGVRASRGNELPTKAGLRSGGPGRELGEIDECGDDPTCGIEIADSPGKRGGDRRRKK